MKRLGLVAILALAAMPAWSAKKITVADLKTMLTTMNQQKKSDADVSAALKQVELSEELLRTTMDSLAAFVPGPLSTEQIYVLEARSALLPPPAADIPAAAAPDAAAQKAILEKAADYVNKTYAQLPSLTATRSTNRFQDNVEAAAPSADPRDKTSTGADVVSPYRVIHYLNVTDSNVVLDHGAEKMPTEKDKTPWGANKMIALEMPDPSLSSVFQEAQNAGTIKFVRWETVNGNQTAVFSYDVPKKKGRLLVNICCFPEGGATSIASFQSATSGYSPTGGGWTEYKTNVPYHGEIFIAPDSGVVVRLIAEAGLKQSDIVRQTDERIDYGPVKVGGNTLVVPVRTIVSTEVVPSGDPSAGAFTTRRTLFTSDFKNYQISAEK